MMWINTLNAQPHGKKQKDLATGYFCKSPVVQFKVKYYSLGFKFVILVLEHENGNMISKQFIKIWQTAIFGRMGLQF